MKKTGEYKQLLKTLISEWKWIFAHSAKYKGPIFLYIVLGIFGVGFSLCASVLSKYLIDAVLGHDSNGLISKCIFVVLFAAIQLLFNALTSWISAKTNTKVNNELRNECYSKVVGAEWLQINRYHTGEIINRLEGDVSSVSSVIIGFIPGLIIKLSQFVASFCILFYFDKVLACLSLLSAPVLFIASRSMVKTIRKYNKLSREKNGEILAFSEESVRNIQIIKTFDLVKKYISDFRDLLETYRNITLSYEKFSIIMTMLFSLTGLAVTYGCYGWAVYRLWNGVITVGSLTLFVQLSSYLKSSFSGLASMLPGAVSVATAAGRLRELCSVEQERASDYSEAEKLSGSSISLVIDKCSFAYNQNKVLDNISFECKTGDFVAVVGKSGAGKTTLLKLLTGLLHPTSGSVYIKDQNGTEINVDSSSRTCFSYVPQEPCIFSGTIRENLLLGNQSASDDLLVNTLKTVELYDFVASLPAFLDTVLGERGTNLSSGQAQRLSVARALLKESPVLLFDESTSALDNATENKLLENIKSVCSDKILIFTTHKQSIMDYCDFSLTIN